MQQIEDTGFEAIDSESGHEQLDVLVNRMRDEQETVERLQEELKQAQSRLRKVGEEQIPDLMDELGLEQFKTRSGFKITVRKELRHSLTKDKKPVALSWLEDNGHADIIKRHVGIDFVVGEEDKAAQVEELLSEEYAGRVSQDRTVAGATLKALLKKMLADGVDVPLELFGAFEQRITRVETSG